MTDEDITDNYTPVAKLSNVPPGKTLKVMVARLPLLLANVNNQIFAVDDTCTHEDSSLALGCLRGELVSCTLHGSRFNVRTGEPVEEPATEPLNTYEVRIVEGEIFVRSSRSQ